MKKFLLSALASCIFASAVSAQCSSGYTATSLNWDNLDFLVQDPTYISASQAQTQYFAFGTNRLTFNHNYSSTASLGEVADHTAETLSNGIGQDLKFYLNGTITLTFASPVEKLKFSLYDVDYKQKVAVTANNGIVPQVVSLSAASGTDLSINNIIPTAPTATASATPVDIASTDGTLNVSINSPVTSVTITITLAEVKSTGNPKEDGFFYFSDISGCTSTTTFPSAYYQISKPFTNQPGYVLTAVDNKVLQVNPANGNAKELFADITGNNINSLAYDPYNKLLYYTYSLTGTNGAVNPNNKAIQKYNVTTGAFSTIVSNVNTFGIPTYGSGIESGGAAFYNGALYIGVEGMAGDESKIWRIDFDASFNPIVPARQVFAIATDNHDWSDFGISNGILYDFDGSANAENLYHINMETGATVTSYTTAALAFTPRQVGIDWNEKIYNIGTAATSSVGTIAPYAGGAITTAQQYTISVAGVNPSGSWGDGAEAFKPLADFGDAPSSYDPDPLAPALHEVDPNLRLGNTSDLEANKTASANADADGGDEDGSPFVSILNQNSGNYLTQVDVYNNTGAPATLCAWVDFNNNGIFETGEGKSITVLTGTAMQRIDMFWTGISTSLAAFSNVFMRVRVTSASNGMTTANSTGYFANGEVEDHRVLVNQATLPLKITSFTANKTGENKVQVNWTSTEEEPNVAYTLERSADSRTWTAIFSKSINRASAFAAHQFIDESPATPVSYYRLMYKDAGGEIRYTAIKKVDFAATSLLTISPNPAKDRLQVELTTKEDSKADVSLYGMDGKLALRQQLHISKGYNKLSVSFAQSVVNGLYTVKIEMNNEVFFNKIVVNK